MPLLQGHACDPAPGVWLSSVRRWLCNHLTEATCSLSSVHTPQGQIVTIRPMRRSHLAYIGEKIHGALTVCRPKLNDLDCQKCQKCQRSPNGDQLSGELLETGGLRAAHGFNFQSLAILAFLAIVSPVLCFTLMLTGILPSNFFTARASRLTAQRSGMVSKSMKMCWLLKSRQCSTLASHLLYLRRNKFTRLPLRRFGS